MTLDQRVTMISSPTWTVPSRPLDPDPTNAAGARLLLPFMERAEQAWPDEVEAARLMRDGLAFLGSFCCGGRVGPTGEAALMVAARNYLASAA